MALLLPVRAPDTLRDLARDLNVVNNFAFQPHRRLVPATPATRSPLAYGGVQYEVTPLLTLCNCYVAVFTAALGCPIPPMKANDQLTWLESNEGRMAGWFSVNRTLALERASLGYPTVAAAVEQPHGHIAMVIPGRAEDKEAPYVSAAGAQNFIFAPMVKSFGFSLDRAAKFFTHN